MTPSILEFLPNQPFIFHDVSVPEDCCNSCDEEYCLKYQPGDPVKIQFRQRWGEDDTKPNLVCTSNFQDFVGGDLVTNGGFTGSPTSWTLNPAGGGGTMIWSNDELNIVAGNSSANILQALAGLVVGKTYRIKFTIRNFIKGAFLTQLGTDVAVQSHTGNGTFTDIITYTAGTAEVKITFADPTTCTIDDVSVIEVGPCWVYGNGNILLDDSGLTHIPGSATSIYNSGTGQPSAPFGKLFNGIYAFRVKTKNITTGTFKIKSSSLYAQSLDGLGGITDNISENGEFTLFLTVTNPDFTEYQLSSDFDGTIESVYCYQLYSAYSGDGFVFHMTDLSDNYMGDMTPFVNYNQDYITIYTSMDTINFGLNPYGCYKIKVADPLPNIVEYENKLPQGDFNDDSLWTTATGMTVNDTVTAAPSRAGRLFVSANGTLSTNVTLVDGNTYYLWLNRIENAAAYTITIKYGGVTLASYNILAGNIGNSGHGFVVNAPVGDLLEITFTGLTANTLFESAQIYLDSSLYDTFAFESNCVSYQESFPCTKIIDAYSPGFQYGFFFPVTYTGFPINDYINDQFSLWQRVSIVSFNPSYPTGQEIAGQSNGDDNLTFASRKKYKTLHFDNVNEAVHDCISVQRICSHFFIYPGVGFGGPALPLWDKQFKYVSKKEDYVIDNDKDGKRRIPQSRIEVALIKNNLFFTKEV